MEKPAAALIVVLLTLIVVELWWSRANRRMTYSLKDALANFGIAIGGGLIRPLALTWNLAILSVVEPFQLFSLPTSAAMFAVTFVVVDFTYYWFHRWMHAVPMLWTMHHTHHSSPWYNFTTAIRLNWVAKFVSPLFFLPLVMLGFPPTWILICLGVGLIYQLFLHTNAVPRLGRFEGTCLNTPSAHRVHHGCNSHYIDKNFAGVFIIWDQLFGTYQPEQADVRFGVTTGFIGHNPFVIQLAPLIRFARGDWERQRASRPRVGYVRGEQGKPQ